MDFKNMKSIIEKMDKVNQLYILKILYENNCDYTENSNGVFINLIFVKMEVLKKINNYIKYISLQETNLNKFENIKNKIKNEYIKTI